MRIVILLLLTGATGWGQEPGGIPLAEARRAFEDAEAAAVADGGRLWGRELSGPMIFADRATRAVVANQPDEADRLVEREGLFTGTLPREIGIANTATQWAGVRWTMVAWPLPADRAARTQLLMHESFHRIQPELGHRAENPLNAHLDAEEGRVWLRLEFRALAQALRASPEARVRAAEDALLFRAQRRALFPGAAAEEAALERNEGLAEYTGLALCGLPAAGVFERAAARLLGEERSESFSRSFAYATGPAYGLLLDGARPGWREELDARSDLAALLAQALPWAAPEVLVVEALGRADQHGGDAVFAAEEELARRRAEELAGYRARFVDGPVLVLPFGSSMNFTFDPSDVRSAGDLGSVYGSIRIADDWGILDVVRGGALLVRDANGAPKEARVSAGTVEGRPNGGESWKLSPNDGWTLAPGPRAGDFVLARVR